MRELVMDRTFTITTPMKANRKITLSEQFDDPEFTAWSLEGNEIFLSNDSGMLKFSYHKGMFKAKDYRGGISTLTPSSTDVEKWKEAITGQRPEQVLLDRFTKKLEINKTSDIAVISDVSQKFGDTYAPEFTLEQMFSELFEAGYEYVVKLSQPFYTADRTFIGKCDRKNRYTYCRWRM